MHKDKRKIVIVFFSILIGVLFYCISQIKVTTTEGNVITISKMIDTSINNAINNILEEDDFQVDVNIEKPYVTANQNYVVNLKVNDDFDIKNYEVLWGIGEDLDSTTLIEDLSLKFNLSEEGKNTCIIKVVEGDNVIYNWEKDVFYIEPYKKQFLDELELHGVSDYFMWMDINTENELFEYLGEKVIRSDIRQSTIEESGYVLFDRTIPEMIENNYKVIGILGGFSSNFFKKDGKVTCQDDLDKFLEYAEEIIIRYPDIYAYEILNEPNIIYTTEEDIEWYLKMVEGVKDIIEKNNLKSLVVAGATVNPTSEEDTRMPSIEFLNKITELGAYNIADIYSFHLYDFNTINNINEVFKKSNNEHKEFINDIGGFQKLYLTEMGYEAKDGKTEEIQAIKIIQQEIITEEYNIELPIVFSFRDTGGRDWGINNGDYEPKKVYISLKNYYEKTNGSEYIGTINLADGLEAHVYDKDGKPKIIAWSANSDNTVEIDYTDFTAKDLYGKVIENTNGKLDITTSPVYLYNISTKYFYEAISNTALEKYSEFEEKFDTEIASVEGLQENINTLKQYLESISNIENESEETAKQKMKEHFDLGNQILTAYKEKKLNVEYVKLSSMLDMLNEIGDSFEDLVTVTAKTRNPDLENTKTLIDNTEQAINNNNDLDIIYPEKILEFSKELYEDSEYINNLEEENDIKTGLIVSYDLHAKYLADWANAFTNLYIDKYIEENPVTVGYSATSLTNQDVRVTLNIPQDVKITNNEGSNTYIFTENGTFTFEYERRGKTDSEIVSVNYIDKTSPEITNVENGEVYTQRINPNVSDEHLDKVQLTLKGQVIEDYEIGDELTEEGEYKLTATDTVGNTSTVKFYIMKEDSTYKIKDSNILNISPETTTKSFMENFTVIEGYKIKNEDVELGEEDNISTGDVLEDEDGTKFILVVKGDLNCDGRLSIVDLSIERKYLLGIIDIDEVQRLSSDMNTDEETSLTDLSIMRKTILGIIK